jgi:hypothetical protein
METVKMAISSGDSTSFLYSVQKVAETIYHTLNFFNHVSDDTLNVLVGLCAGRGALLQMERKQTLKLFKHLTASQTHTPVFDDEAWAAEVGGSIVGEIEGHRSYLTPWAEPNFGVKFLYRRAAEEPVYGTAQDLKYSIYPRDGTVHGALLTSNTSTPSPRSAVAVNSKLPRTPLSTPPSKSTSKQISHFPSANEYVRCPSFITLPTSQTRGEFPKACVDILDNQSTLQPQILTKKPKALSRSPGLLTILFSQEEGRTLDYRGGRAEGKGSSRNKPKPEKIGKEQERGAQRVLEGVTRRIRGFRGKEDISEDTDDNMGSLEVKQMRLQQLRRLQKTLSAAPAELQKPGKEIPRSRSIIPYSLLQCKSAELSSHNYNLDPLG